jgi:hypothetical protein
MQGLNQSNFLYQGEKNAKEGEWLINEQYKIYADSVGAKLKRIRGTILVAAKSFLEKMKLHRISAKKV